MNLGKFILLFIYCILLSYLINKGLNNKILTSLNFIILILNSIFICLMIINSNFLLPKQFTPLHELNAIQKIWRIMIAIMAIFWGGLITFGMLTNIALGKATIAQSIADIIFAFVAYAGIKILATKT